MSGNYDGRQCACGANSESECACEGVDWTPKELIDLRAEVHDMKARAVFTSAQNAMLIKARQTADAKNVYLSLALDVANKRIKGLENELAELQSEFRNHEAIQ